MSDNTDITVWEEKLLGKMYVANGETAPAGYQVDKKTF